MEREVDVLRDFETFLSQLGTVSKKRTKFSIHWVRRSLKSCNDQLENINTDCVSQFLDSLDADKKIADYQVKPASGAVTLYVERYPSFGATCHLRF